MKIGVIGTFNIDFVGSTDYDLIKGESHPGLITIEAGGVARNITENLGRMGADITFFTAVGRDAYGEKFKKDLEAQNVKIKMPLSSTKYNTSIYFAINNKQKNLEYAVVNTDILELINVDYLKEIILELNNFDYLLLDTNISEEAIDYIFKHVKTKIIVDTVSLIKSNKIIPYLKDIYLLKANYHEYMNLSKYLEEAHPMNLIVTNGSHNVTYIHEGKKKQYMPYKNNNILSTTGAGDAFLAGVVYTLLNGKTIDEGIKMGLKFSYYTLNTKDAVNKSIKELIEKSELL